jgi:hypothetical protein
MKRFLLLIALVGCGDSGELAAMRAAFENAKETVVSEQKATAEKTTEAVVILKENTAALARIETKLEASLAKSEPQNGKDGDPASAPESPAKANTQPTPVQVATPGTSSSRVASDGTVLRWNIEGNWNPTILETSAHLREHGINTDGMTHQEMADIHASIHDGKPVAGKPVAMKSETVRYVSRGMSCPNGQCPTSSTRYVRRSRR